MYTFTDSEFMTAEEKVQVFKAWERFLKSNFSRTAFTKALYQHLTLHCAFIAHYSIDGFYGVYFQPIGHKTARFLDQFHPSCNGASVEYGFYSSWHDNYVDINTALCEATLPHRNRLLDLCREGQYRHDYSDALRAAEKIGMKLVKKEEGE